MGFQHFDHRNTEKDFQKTNSSLPFTRVSFFLSSLGTQQVPYRIGSFTNEANTLLSKPEGEVNASHQKSGLAPVRYCGSAQASQVIFIFNNDDPLIIPEPLSNFPYPYPKPIHLLPTTSFPIKWKFPISKPRQFQTSRQNP